ncbi:MAG TPA: PIG-L deacetylase family protein [Acidimicrobiales bacterium]|nr:PIG-L deacetylase family protein [Acidimicrobiales bacterium]
MTRTEGATDHHRGPSGLPVGDLLAVEPVTADLPVPAAVLAVGAHPDDIEFGCGATLAKWAAAGSELHYLVLTDGSKGSWRPDADIRQLVADRRQECHDAAAVVDGRPHRTSPPPDRVFFLQRVDGELENGIEERRAVARIIRLVRPTVVLGHDPWRRYRLHPDHRAAGFITVDALVGARDQHFFSELGLEPHRPESLLLWEADLPNHLEDARGFEDVKIEALLCHHSQLESTMGIRDLAPSPGGSGPESAPQASEFASKVLRQLAAHGSLAGYRSAEAFRLMTDL